MATVTIDVREEHLEFPIHQGSNCPIFHAGRDAGLPVSAVDYHGLELTVASQRVGGIDWMYIVLPEAATEWQKRHDAVAWDGTRDVPAPTSISFQIEVPDDVMSAIGREAVAV